MKRRGSESGNFIDDRKGQHSNFKEKNSFGVGKEGKLSGGQKTTKKNHCPMWKKVC